MSAFLKRHWPVLLLTLIGLISYHRWLNFSDFMNGDWTFHTAAELKAQLAPSVWLASARFGEIDLLVWRWPTYALYGIVALLFGAGSSVSDKLFVFWPIAFLLPVAGYLLVRRLTGSRIGGFVGGLVLAYNTYFLAIDTQGHELITVAAVFGVFALLSYEKILEKPSMPGAIAAALYLAACGFLDFRIAYLFAAVMAGTCLFDAAVTRGWRRKAREWRIVAAPFLIFGALNVFWLAPQLALHQLTSNAVLDRGLFGDQFWSLRAALTLFHPFWNGSAPEWFSAQPVPMAFWCIPIAAFLGMTLRRKDPRIVFYGLLALAGVFLTKQGDPPFSLAYSWLFRHVPGFNAFREATKFYVLVALGYAVTIGALAGEIHRWRPSRRSLRAIRFAAVPALCALFLFNAWPMIDGRIDTLFTPNPQPASYAALERTLAADADFSRVLSVPPNGRWQPFSGAHPKIIPSDLDFGPDAAGLSWDAASGTTLTGVDALLRPQAARAFDLAGVGYVLLPPAKEGDKGPYRQPKDRAAYQALLDSRPYLKKLGDDAGLVTYATTSHHPHLYLTKEEESLSHDVAYEPVDVLRASATRYEFSLAPSSEAVYLQFSEAYQPDWRLYEGRVNWFDILSGRASAADDDHLKNAVDMNSYRLDPVSSRRTLTLYFRPQAYLVLGLLVSGAVLAACVTYLILARLRRGKKPV